MDSLASNGDTKSVRTATISVLNTLKQKSCSYKLGSNLIPAHCKLHMTLESALV